MAMTAIASLLLSILGSHGDGKSINWESAKRDSGGMKECILDS